MATKISRPVGRPQVLPDGTRRTTVSLTPAEIALARKLGTSAQYPDGNLSAGLRIALEQAKEQKT